MLGRKTYTREELDHAKAAIDAQLAAYKTLVDAATGRTDETVSAAIEAFEAEFFNNMIKLIPDQSVVKLHIGDPIRLTHEEFERLAAAFFDAMENRFL